MTQTCPFPFADCHLCLSRFLVGSPRHSSTLPRSSTADPTTSPRNRRNSDNMSTSYSGNLSLQGTPVANRRHSSLNRSFNVRTPSSRLTSPSPVRRSASRESASYRVALPRTLYGDDEGADSGNDLMTQSLVEPPPGMRMVPGGGGVDVMTASCVPDIVGRVNRGQEAWSGESPARAHYRPSTLFSSDRDGSASDGGGGMYLQDLSDSE
jgi:hypothetical protein